MQRPTLAALALGCLTALTLTCFGRVLFGGEQFGFRDASQYYYPLHQRIQAQWDAGRLPLWEPLENSGTPLLGNPTAAVLYPGKIVFAALPYPWASRIYVIGHTLLACAAMAALGRGLGLSRTASVLAGLAYAFGGPVLFLHTNVIYLVGAAWLPLGLLTVGRLAGTGSPRHLTLAGAMVTLSVLGGDPESAYLAVLAGAIYVPVLYGLGDDRQGRFRGRAALAFGGAIAATAIAGWVIDSAQLLFSSALQATRLAAWIGGGAVVAVCALSRRAGVRPLARGWARLAAASALAAALAGVQLVPAAEFALRSFRAAESAPLDIYRFSLEPIRVVELAWPNVTGTAFPENHQWLVTWKPEGPQQFWTPSLYIGGLTLALALAGATLTGPPARVWLTVLALGGLLASLGRIGGIYTLMAGFLPGFGAFRYPAKLTVLAALGACGLAGFGWDRLLAGHSRRALAASGGLLALGLLALGLVQIRRGEIIEAWSRAPQATSLAGPLDPEAALADVRQALAHGTAVFGALIVITAVIKRGAPQIACIMVLLVMTLDLIIANMGLVWTVPQADLERPSEAARRIRSARPGVTGASTPPRVFRMPSWYPSRFTTTRSPDRLRELVAFERDTLLPAHELTAGMGQTFSPGIIELYDYLWFFRPMRLRADPGVSAALGVRPGTAIVYYPRKSVDMWGSEFLILPARPEGWTGEARGYAAFLERATPLYPAPSSFEGPGGDERRRRWEAEQDWQLVRNDGALPRAWIVHDARVVPPVAPGDDETRSRVMRRLLFANDAIWHDDARPVLDVRTTALVELEDPRALAGFRPGGATVESERVAIVRDEPTHVELTATLERPGLVILADTYYPGWALTIDGQPAPVLRVNRLMRGAAVKPGRHRIVYRYEPRSLWAGLSFSLIGLACCGLLVWHGGRLASGRAVA
jgi:hypothetical protein